MQKLNQFQHIQKHSYLRTLYVLTYILVSSNKYNQSLFKTSPVTRRPSLKRLSGIHVQLLSHCMGKHQILQICSLSLQ